MLKPAINKLFCAALSVLAGAAPLRAGDYSRSAAGTSSGKFLSFGSSARAAGMGEAYCAAPQEADAVRYNPAALTRIEANSAEVMHANYLAETFLDYGAFARRLGSSQAIGLSALQMSYGSVAKTDETGFPTGSAHPANLALTGAYAYKFDGLGGFLDGSAAGVSASYVQSTIVSTAKTFTASLGLLSPAYGPAEVQVAIVAENLAGKLKFDQEADPLPMTFKLGAIMHLEQDWILALDLVGPKDNAPYAAVGTEKGFTTRSDMRLALRAGYNMRSAKDIAGLSGFAAGLGISLSGMSLDYALVPFGDLGYTHKLSLGYSFGAGRDEAPRPAAKKEPAKIIPEPAPVEPADPIQKQLQAADKYLAQKDYEKAAAEYQIAFDLIPATDNRRIYVCERQGLTELKRQSLPKARKYFIAAAQLAKKAGITDATVVNAYMGLGYCFKEDGNAEAAIKNYEKAMTLSTNGPTKKRIKGILRKLKAKPG